MGWGGVWGCELHAQELKTLGEEARDELESRVEGLEVDMVVFRGFREVKCRTVFRAPGTEMKGFRGEDKGRAETE